MSFLLFLLILLPVWLRGNEAAQEIPYYYQLTWQEFYALPATRQTIPLHQPDYYLLEAAVFQATNRARVQEGKAPFHYLPSLHQSATFHSEAMRKLEFYDHYNLKQPLYLTPHKRITAFGGFFHYTAENIAQYDIINTDQEYCPARQPNGTFKYLNCQTNKLYRAYTYIGYAEVVVNGWMHSPPHRVNILNDNYQYLGCAARISLDPYRQRHVPFARLTQNFGGYRNPKEADSTAGKN